MKNSNVEEVDLEKMKMFFDIKENKFTSIKGLKALDYKIVAISKFMKDRQSSLKDGWVWSSFNTLFNFKTFDVFYKRYKSRTDGNEHQMWIAASKKTGAQYIMVKLEPTTWKA